MTRSSRITLIAALALTFTAVLVWLSASLSSTLPAEAMTRTPTPPPTRRPSVTPTPTPKPPPFVRLPILMYHYVSAPPPGSDKLRVDLSVSPEQFEAQLKYLRENDYTTVSLQEVHDLLSKGRRLPPKPVVLTFDDGYLDHYTNAFRLLKKHKMTGTFFVVTDYAVYKNPEHVTWAMITEMAKAGMSIQSHSRTHKDMRNRSNDFLVWEILGPVEQIEAYAGKKPRFFCYPTGRRDSRVEAMLRNVGTLAAVTTEFGNTYRLDNAMAWPRLRVRNTMTIGQFASLVKTDE